MKLTEKFKIDSGGQSQRKQFIEFSTQDVGMNRIRRQAESIAESIVNAAVQAGGHGNAAKHEETP